MFTRNHLFASSLPFLSPDGGAAGGGGNEGNPPEIPPTPPAKPEFDDAQQKLVNDLLARERKDAEEKTALRLKAEADAKAKADKEQRDLDAAAARGDFDTARTELEAKAASAATERDGLKAQNDELLLLVKADVDSQWDGLPEEVKATYAGEDGDILAKRRHMQLMKPVIDRLIKSTGTPGLRQGPNPRGDDFNQDEEIAKARLRTGLRF